MILRPRQTEFVDKALKALEEYGNSMGVAPTGAGKTVMLSAIAGDSPGTTLILQHRDELVEQNRNTFKLVNPGIKAEIFNSKRKKFIVGGATFAMVPTLYRENNLVKMPFLDRIIIDETHHVAAESYKKIISKARNDNPAIQIFGVTATPMRADKKALRGVFNNVCDVVTITELIHSGHLVKPRTFVIDCGLKTELDAARAEMSRKRLSDYDMSQIGEIMDKSVVNERVFEEWQRVAGARRTVIFCSTVEHATHISKLYSDKGVKSEVVSGATPKGERKAILRRIDTGATQVLVNVAVLTEGFDCQPLACVVLLRPCSHKSTMLQMIGRGLRRVDPERYPGITKDDCIVLDFGYSLLTHGNFNVDIELEPTKKTLPAILCPNCSVLIPASVMECPNCGEIINVRPIPAAGSLPDAKDKLENFVLTEIDLLDASPFKWVDLFGGAVSMCNGIEAWSCVAWYRPSGRWFAIGGGKGVSRMGGAPHKLLGHMQDRFGALAVADDFMRQFGDRKNAEKSKSWMTLESTDQQLRFLNITPDRAFGLTRYQATIQQTWKMFEGAIKAIIETTSKSIATQ